MSLSDCCPSHSPAEVMPDRYISEKLKSDHAQRARR